MKCSAYSLFLSLLAATALVHANPSVEHKAGTLLANPSPEGKSVPGVGHSITTDSSELQEDAAASCSPGWGLCPNGRCCPDNYPWCCPKFCCPKGYPYCGKNGRCYASP